MKIIHRVSASANEAHFNELQQAGIEPNIIGGDLHSFDIDEGHISWPIVEKLIRDWKAVDVPRTEFSAGELKKAALLQMGPSWHHGYPQPDEAFGYVELTYDTTQYCATCGIGAFQKAPFRMSREPRWGMRKTLQLNWVFDEFFVTPQAFETVFKPFGIENLPVFHHKNGLVLATVLQLVVPRKTDSPIATVGLPTEQCATCRRTKFTPVTRGRFPYVSIPKGVHIAKTKEYFGSGGSAWQAIIISAELYAAITTQKLRGADFTVVADADQSRF
jgi:hypothetical protein